MIKETKQTIFVNVLLEDGTGAVLMVRRAQSEGFLPGYFEFPGGRVEIGETAEHAIRRKLSSELGVAVSDLTFLVSVSRVDQKGPYLRMFFVVGVDKKIKLDLANNYDEINWVDKKTTLDQQIASDAKLALSTYFLQANVDEKTTYKKVSQYIINTDGGSRGNPGPSASAFVIYDKTGSKLEEGGEYIGIATNNQAEYTGVLLALRAAMRLLRPSDRIEMRIDSLLVVNQMNGMYKIKNRELWPLHQKIREIIPYFSEVRFIHIPRDQNIAADGRVNHILDRQQKI